MELDTAARTILNAVNEGVTIIDTEGRVVFCNEAYLAFLRKEGIPAEDLEGRPLRDIRPGARLPEVLRTQRPILHAPRQEKDDIYFVNLYPVFQDGVLAGGVSVVTFRQQAYDFRAELESYEQRSRQVLHRINQTNSARYTFDSITAGAPASAAVKDLAFRIAATDATVLLESESGTGKELYAQAIHNASPRSQNVFVAINCANFNPNMLEAELFGYAGGAFTGAKKGGKIGLFEAADGGTLFLDEVSEMDLSLQASLLRVLQERQIRPVGSVRQLDVDVRVIAACNADLRRYVEEGKFRKDLYYRLNTFPIRIPPLRERPEDIPALTAEILSEFSRKLKRTFSIAPEALDALAAYDWPGNIRELKNVLEVCAYLTSEGPIPLSALPENIARAGAPRAQLTLSQRTRQFEKAEILRLLRKNGASLAGKRQTARELGISLSSLYNKLGGPEF